MASERRNVSGPLRDDHIEKARLTGGLFFACCIRCISDWMPDRCAASPAVHGGIGARGRRSRSLALSQCVVCCCSMYWRTMESRRILRRNDLEWAYANFFVCQTERESARL